jgi:hypothetical protein
MQNVRKNKKQIYIKKQIIFFFYIEILHSFTKLDYFNNSLEYYIFKFMYTSIIIYLTLLCNKVSLKLTLRNTRTVGISGRYFNF